MSSEIWHAKFSIRNYHQILIDICKTISNLASKLEFWYYPLTRRWSFISCQFSFIKKGIYSAPIRPGLMNVEIRYKVDTGNRNTHCLRMEGKIMHVPRSTPKSQFTKKFATIFSTSHLLLNSAPVSTCIIQHFSLYL